MTDLEPVDILPWRYQATYFAVSKLSGMRYFRSVVRVFLVGSRGGVLIFLGSIVLKQLEKMSCKKVMCVYAQFKKVTWNVYTHAQFSDGLDQDKVSIFIFLSDACCLLVVFDFPGKRACV